jgi:3-dehydroquinate synthetase
MTDVQTRKEVDGWIQYALIPVVKRLEALEQSNRDQLAKARAADTSYITDETVQRACEIYSEVYANDDKDMGDAMRAALEARLPPDWRRDQAETSRLPPKSPQVRDHE